MNTDRVRSWIEVVARAGYAARGVVYLLVGFFAVLAAFGSSDAKGTEAALQALLAQPLGTVMVGAVALGLAAFFFWRTVQAVRDTDAHGTDAKGIVARVALFVGGLSYAAIALLAATLAAGSRDEGGGDPTGAWIASAYALGIGWMLVYGVAAVLFAVGIAHIVRAIRASFEKYFQCSGGEMRWLRPLSRFGLIARGVVFIIVGALVVSGGLAYRAEDRPGLADALSAVQGYGFGWLVLLAIALGLMAFGLYSLAEARYRCVTVG